MFISNLLNRHLDKIKKNIGTFKAFGLSNSSLLRIYFTLSTWFVISALVVAFLLSLLFGSLGGVKAGLLFLNAVIEQDESYFDLFNWWLLLSTLMILLVSMMVIYVTASNILKRTPGDLIYDR
jgi:ABC-type antimicrobial peptide transport system permease subunit